MSKTIDQIASDCGLYGADIETLRDVAKKDWADFQDWNPVSNGFCHIIEALYRRIVVLDRRQEFREAMGIKTEDAKWLDPECHGGCQSLVLKCHIKKLEEGRQSSIDCLNHISIDCQMALNETWDTDYDGFRAMLNNVNDTLRKLGAEPPTEDIKK